MKSRTKRPHVEESTSLTFDEFEDSMDLESLSEEELEDFLFDDEPESDNKGIFNLPTVAGLSIITVGIVYLFEKLGILNGFSGLQGIASMLPWLAGILIILLGFGVLSWRPSGRKKRVKKAIEVPSGKKKVVVEPAPPSSRSSGKRRLERSRNKKLAGVCGGIAEYFRIDPTLVRIAFVIGMVSTTGLFFGAYLLLAFVMPAPPPRSVEERITIIRDT
jgi:phage shock protein C